MKIVSFALSFVLVIVLLFTFFTTYNNVGLYEIDHTEVLRSTGELGQFDATFHSTLGVGEVRTIEFTTEDEYIAIGITTAQKLKIFKQNLIDDCYDALSPAISTTGLGDVYGVDFTDSTNVLAVGHNSTPFIKIYDRVGDTFTANTDIDLILDDTVLDLKFYDNDNYLIVGGDFTNFLQVFKYENGDYTKLSGNIDTLPTGRVWDIDYSNGYIFIATEATPYLIVYKQVGDNLVKIDNPASLPTDKAYSIAVNDRGDYIAIGQETTPFIKVYKWDNESMIEIPLDVIPTQTLVTWTVHFIDNTYLYVGGDLTLYKYKINDLGTEFINETNDMTDFTAPIYVMDHTKTLNRIALGDSSGYDCYLAEIELEFDSLYLREEPESITSIRQSIFYKDYILDGNELIVIDQDYNIDLSVKYVTLGQELDPLVVIIPILVMVAVIGTIVFYIKD